MTARPSMNLRSLVRPTLSSIRIGEHRFVFEIANTRALRILGLSDRDHVRPDAAGMLFAFPSVDHHTVWNAGMRFPFDVAFVGFDFNGGQGRFFLSRIVTALPPSDPARPTRFTSPTRSNFVLETPAGWFAARGFRAGTDCGFPSYVEAFE